MGRTRRQVTRRQRAAPAFFLAGALSGAALTGLTAWIASVVVNGFPMALRLSAWIALVTAAFLTEFRLIETEFPQNRRQVPREVFRPGILRAASRFGFEMGTGLLTYLPSPAPHVLAATVVLFSGDIRSAGAAALGFGLSRGIVPALRWISGDSGVWEMRLAKRVRVLAMTCLAGVVGVSAALIHVG